MSDKQVVDLDKLERGVRQSDGSWVARCPACAENGSDKQGNHFRIWSNGAYHCVVNSDKEHNLRVLQLVGTNADPNAPVYTTPAPKVNMPTSWPRSILTGLVKNHDYWVKRGISEATCNYFNMGIATKGQMAGRTVVPILDRGNPDKIIGFTGRALYDGIKPKWRHLGDKKRWLLPADDIEIAKAKSIILLESPADALFLWDHGIRNTICLFGVTVSSAIVSYLIKAAPERVLIATNNEMDSTNGGIGNQAAEKIMGQLEQFFNPNRIHIALPLSKDFAAGTREQIEEYKTLWNL